MRVLVTGAGGQVGTSLVRSAPREATITAAIHSELDITDSNAIEASFRAVRPEVVINAAAFTLVDAAESDTAGAERTNVEGVRLLAEACRASRARLIHVSTDYVFDGAQESPYRPDDPPRPLSVYGRTKWAGEQCVREILPATSLVIRTSWLYSASGRNFVTRMLDLMNRLPMVRVVDDQHGIPTAADSLARILWAFASSPSAGTYHWSDANRTTWYQFARAIAEEGIAAGLISSAPQIVPIKSSEYPTAATRPANSVLDRSATETLLGLRARPWRDTLRDTLRDLSDREHERTRP